MWFIRRRFRRPGARPMHHCCAMKSQRRALWLEAVLRSPVDRNRLFASPYVLWIRNNMLGLKFAFNRECEAAKVQGMFK